MHKASTSNQANFSFHLWPRAKNKKRSGASRLLPGRPKQQNPVQDLGTPELQLKRKVILHNKHNQRLSISTLDALYARDLIDKHQHQAGRSYVSLHSVACKILLAPRLRQSAKELGQGSKRKKVQSSFDALSLESEKKCAAIERKWRACQKALLNDGRDVFDIIHKAIIFDEIELDSIGNNSPKMLKLQQGLNTLDRFFRC